MHFLKKCFRCSSTMHKKKMKFSIKDFSIKPKSEVGLGDVLTEYDKLNYTCAVILSTYLPKLQKTEIKEFVLLMFSVKQPCVLKSWPPHKKWNFLLRIFLGKCNQTAVSCNLDTLKKSLMENFIFCAVNSPALVKFKHNRLLENGER